MRFSGVGFAVAPCRQFRQTWASQPYDVPETGPPRPYPVLYIRFLFAYDNACFKGPMVLPHELTHRINARGATRRPQSVDIARPRMYCFLRLPGNAAPLALLSSENLAQSGARSISRRCESDQPAVDCAFREGTRT